MDIAASKKLFDIVTRQSLYIEQVKLGETQKLSSVLSEIEDEFLKLLGRLKYDNLDAMSKAQLTLFLKNLRVSQTRVYSRYQKQFIERLQAFMAASVEQTTMLSASFYAHTLLPAESTPDEIELLSVDDSLLVIEEAMKANETTSLFGFAILAGTSAALKLLWSKIRNSPLPSGGALPMDYVNVAIASSMLNLEQTVRNAWANKKTITELKADVIGGVVKSTLADGSISEANVTGAMRRISNGLSGVVSTLSQHVAQQSLAAVNSAIWPEYVWVAVIDERTSAICFERNGKTWPYGKGPLPPAHPWCRSHTMPFDFFDSEFVMPTFYEWLKAQPIGFISSVFGSTIADKFAEGSIKRADFDKFKPFNSKSVAEFLAGTGDLI